MKTIGFIGGGRITKIFLQAFKNINLSFEKVVVTDSNADTLQSLKNRFPQIIITENIHETASNDIVIVALHPPVLLDTLVKIKDSLNRSAILISLAPKITIDQMTAALGGFTNIARMNPSASSIVNKGVNPITFSAPMTKQAKEELLKIFQNLGYTPEVAEHKIEAYAVISAMGHTYFNFQLQKLRELAISFGMDEGEASKTISNMLWGTTETLYNSGLSYDEVADLVPVKPMAEVEVTIKGYYDQYLNGIFNKIKPY